VKGISKLKRAAPVMCQDGIPKGTCPKHRMDGHRDTRPKEAR
jgi:hypothetical protein